MGKVLTFIGVGCGGIFALLLVVIVFVGSTGPSIDIYPGRQLPKEYLETVQGLGLLEPEEEVRYFYSDAISEIEEGFYLVTYENLILYSREWAEPSTVVPLDQIQFIDAQYDDSFWQDSYISVTTYEGMELTFPLSSQKGLDRKFVRAIEEGSRDAGAPAEMRDELGEQVRPAQADPTDDYPSDADGDALRRVARDADMSRPMLIDFFVDAPNRSAAEAVRELAEAAGYVVDTAREEDSEAYSCTCSKEMMATYEGVVGAQSELNALFAELEGCKADGWGTFGNVDDD